MLDIIIGEDVRSCPRVGKEEVLDRTDRTEQTFMTCVGSDES